LSDRPPETNSSTNIEQVRRAYEQAANALTAASSPVSKPQSQFLQHTMEWQNEAWGFYDNLAELNTGVTWLSNMLSRVRLKAADIEPGLDEPTVIEKGLSTESRTASSRPSWSASPTSSGEIFRRPGCPSGSGVRMLVIFTSRTPRPTVP